MNRRKFLGSAAAVAAAATWPAWLREAFAAGVAASPEQQAAELAVLSEGFRRAQRAGKPLLVLLIPADDGHKYERGAALGEYLNHGADEQLWPLSLAEVVCATLTNLRRLVPEAGGAAAGPRQKDEPLMVVVETDQVPARFQDLSGKLVASAGGRGLFVEGPQQKRRKGETDEQHWQRLRTEQQRREDQEIAARIAVLSGLVRSGLGPDAAALERRAAQARGHLEGTAAAQLEVALSGGVQPTAEQVAAAPALVAQAALKAQGELRARLLASLAAHVTAKLRKERVPGSKWARSSGCATEIEGETSNVMVACGMGHVPEKSSRFLYFFTKNQML